MPAPGPVVLLVRGGAPEGLAQTADQILAYLCLLFVSAGVVLHFDVLADAAVSMALAILGGTLLAIGTTALVALRLLRR